MDERQSTPAERSLVWFYMRSLPRDRYEDLRNETSQHDWLMCHLADAIRWGQERPTFHAPVPTE